VLEDRKKPLLSSPDGREIKQMMVKIENRNGVVENREDKI
jgi:hypothetical protein